MIVDLKMVSITPIFLIMPILKTIIFKSIFINLIYEDGFKF
jgi:hypothetical protein